MYHYLYHLIAFLYLVYIQYIMANLMGLAYNLVTNNLFPTIMNPYIHKNRDAHHTLVSCIPHNIIISHLVLLLFINTMY